MYIGLDESGKGCLFGPLVISCAYSLNSPSFLYKDSKQLSSFQRKLILLEINKKKEYLFRERVIPAERIDEYVYKQKLNNLLVIQYLSIIKEVIQLVNPPHVSIYIDCFYSNEDKLKKEILAAVLDYFSIEKITLLVKHKGDVLFPLCSVASIHAKERRDQLLNNFIKENPLYQIGSGYPSDLRTINFIKNNPVLYDHKKMINIRYSWKIKRN